MEQPILDAPKNVSKPNRVLRSIAIVMSGTVFLGVSALGIYACVLHSRATELLRVIQDVQVGKTSGSDAAKIIRRVKDYKPFLQLSASETGSGSQVTPAPLDQCVLQDCQIQFPWIPNLTASFWKWSYEHPRLLGWLPIKRMPAGLVTATLTVKNGYADQLSFAMFVMSPDRELCPEAFTEIADKPGNGAPWEVRHFVKRPITGGDCGSMHTLSVKATPRASADQLKVALNYNLRCLWPGVRCSECDLLPGMCDRKETRTSVFLPSTDVRERRNKEKAAKFVAKKTARFREPGYPPSLTLWRASPTPRADHVRDARFVPQNRSGRKERASE